MQSPSKKFIKFYNNNTPQIISKKIVADLETPVSALIKLSQKNKFPFLLESVEGGNTRGRYSAIGINPDLIWKCKNGKCECATQGRA